MSTPISSPHASSAERAKKTLKPLTLTLIEAAIAAIGGSIKMARETIEIQLPAAFREEGQQETLLSYSPNYPKKDLIQHLIKLNWEYGSNPAAFLDLYLYAYQYKTLEEPRPYLVAKNGRLSVVVNGKNYQVTIGNARSLSEKLEAWTENCSLSYLSECIAEHDDATVEETLALVRLTPPKLDTEDSDFLKEALTIQLQPSERLACALFNAYQKRPLPALGIAFERTLIELSLTDDELDLLAELTKIVKEDSRPQLLNSLAELSCACTPNNAAAFVALANRLKWPLAKALSAHPRSKGTIFAAVALMQDNGTLVTHLDKAILRTDLEAQKALLQAIPQWIQNLRKDQHATACNALKELYNGLPEELKTAVNLFFTPAPQTTITKRATATLKLHCELYHQVRYFEELAIQGHVWANDSLWKCHKDPKEIWKDLKDKAWWFGEALRSSKITLSNWWAGLLTLKTPVLTLNDLEYLLSLKLSDRQIKHLFTVTSLNSALTTLCWDEFVSQRTRLQELCPEESKTVFSDHLHRTWINRKSEKELLDTLASSHFDPQLFEALKTAGHSFVKPEALLLSLIRQQGELPHVLQGTARQWIHNEISRLWHMEWTTDAFPPLTDILYLANQLTEPIAPLQKRQLLILQNVKTLAGDLVALNLNDPQLELAPHKRWFLHCRQWSQPQHILHISEVEALTENFKTLHDVDKHPILAALFFTLIDLHASSGLSVEVLKALTQLYTDYLNRFCTPLPYQCCLLFSLKFAYAWQTQNLSMDEWQSNHAQQHIMAAQRSSLPTTEPALNLIVDMSSPTHLTKAWITIAWGLQLEAQRDDLYWLYQLMKLLLLDPQLQELPKAFYDDLLKNALRSLNSITYANIMRIKMAENDELCSLFADEQWQVQLLKKFPDMEENVKKIARLIYAFGCFVTYATVNESDKEAFEKIRQRVDAHTLYQAHQEATDSLQLALIKTYFFLYISTPTDSENAIAETFLTTALKLTKDIHRNSMDSARDPIKPFDIFHQAVVCRYLREQLAVLGIIIKFSPPLRNHPSILPLLILATKQLLLWRSMLLKTIKFEKDENGRLLQTSATPTDSLQSSLMHLETLLVLFMYETLPELGESLLPLRKHYLEGLLHILQTIDQAPTNAEGIRLFHAYFMDVLPCAMDIVPQIAQEMLTVLPAANCSTIVETQVAFLFMFQLSTSFPHSQKTLINSLFDQWATKLIHGLHKSPKTYAEHISKCILLNVHLQTGFRWSLMKAACAMKFHEGTSYGHFKDPSFWLYSTLGFPKKSGNTLLEECKEWLSDPLFKGLSKDEQTNFPDFLEHLLATALVAAPDRSIAEEIESALLFLKGREKG